MDFTGDISKWADFYVHDEEGNNDRHDSSDADED